MGLGDSLASKPLSPQTPNRTPGINFLHRDQALWDKYDPEMNSQQSFENFTLGESSCAQTTEGAANSRDQFQDMYDIGFPVPIPPSNASLAQDASDEVLEGEMKRLLGNLMTAWDYIGKRCEELERQLEAEAAEISMDVPEGDEGNEAGDESD